MRLSKEGQLEQSLGDEQFIYDLDELKGLCEDTGKTCPYYSERKYINFGYRASNEMTMNKCTRSVFMMHCETTNIWTHLLATLYFITLLILICTKNWYWKD